MGQCFMDVELPGNPRDVYFATYDDVGLRFEHALDGETAARVLQFSREARKWVGVSRAAILERVEEDERVCNAFIAYNRMRIYAEPALKRSRFWYGFWRICTFGLSTRFLTYPREQGTPPPKPLTLHKYFSVEEEKRFVKDALERLVRAGDLAVEFDEGGERFYSPTKELHARFGVR